MDPRHMWFFAFVSIAGIRCHPRDLEDVSKVDLVRCAYVADRMMAEFIRRFPAAAEDVCLS